MAEDASSNLLCKVTAESGQTQVRFRKGEKNDKDIFIEVWSAGQATGLVSSLKVTDKLSKVYNDVVFGKIAWSRDD